MRVRVVPSIVAYRVADGAAARRRSRSGSRRILAFMRGDVQAERRSAGLAVPDDTEGERVRAVWQSLTPRTDERFVDLVRRVCADHSLWGADLAAFPGFVELVAEHLMRIVRQRRTFSARRSTHGIGDARHDTALDY